MYISTLYSVPSDFSFLFFLSLSFFFFFNNYMVKSTQIGFKEYQCLGVNMGVLSAAKANRCIYAKLQPQKKLAISLMRGRYE